MKTQELVAKLTPNLGELWSNIPRGFWPLHWTAFHNGEKCLLIFMSLFYWKNWSKEYINVSLVVEFQRWWVLKSKKVGQESAYSREIFFKKFVDELRFIKNCQNCIFKVNFQCQKSTEVFQKRISSKYINLGDHFLVKKFFLD